MAERKRIGLREVRALGPGEMVWDAAVAGFHARRQRGPAVTYAVFYRTKEGRQRWHKIGRHGAPWTPEEAREAAIRILSSVTEGADPAGDKQSARKAVTVAQLCDAYLADAEAGRVLARSGEPKKASTLMVDEGRVERHIKPLLGSLAVAAVTRDDVERFMHDVAQGKTAAQIKTKKQGLARVSGGRTAATRAVGLLGAIFTYAIRRRVRADNPAHGIQRFADRTRDRRLSDDEYARLGDALRHNGIWPPAIAATRFLALTGWRSGEVLGLQWSSIDLTRRTATLPDTKTGRSIRPLSHPVCEMLRSLPHIKGDLVFPASRGDSGVVLHLNKIWPRVAKLGGLAPDVTLHVLRHSFASVAADLGYSEPTIAALVGHKGYSLTSRYLHAADAVLLAAADAVARKTAELMGEDEHDKAVIQLAYHGLG